MAMGGFQASITRSRSSLRLRCGPGKRSQIPPVGAGKTPMRARGAFIKAAGMQALESGHGNAKADKRNALACQCINLWIYTEPMVPQPE